MRSRMLFLVIWISLLFHGRASAMQFHTEVLSNLRAALETFNSIQLTSDVIERYGPSSRSYSKAVFQRSVVTLKRHGSRAFLSVKNKPLIAGQESFLYQNDSIIYENGDVLVCQASLNSSMQQLEGVTDDLGFLLYSKRLAGQQEVNSQTVYFSLNDAGALVWVIGYQPLLKYIDDADNLRVAPTELGATVRAVSRYGDLTLDLSRECRWLPRTIRLVKVPTNQSFKGLLGDVYEGKLKSIVWTGDFDEYITDSANHWAPKKISITRETSLVTDKPSEIIETSMNLQHVIYEPTLADADFQTEIIAPIGYSVTVDGAYHLPYEWDGKKAVPRVKPIGEFVKEFANTWISRKGLIAFNVIFLVIVFYYLWRRTATA